MMRSHAFRASWLAMSGALAIGCTIGISVLPDGHFELDGAVFGRDAGVSSECSEGSTLGEPCTTTAECSDGCFCNGVEICVEGICVGGATRCDDGLDCTIDVCDEAADRCVAMPDHAMCADPDPCNGVEVCDTRRGCRPGPLLDCNDSNTCTIDTCDAAMGGCVHRSRDLDGDGHIEAGCGGDDCDDANDAIAPGLPELCAGGRDDDCNGSVDALDPSCIAREGACSSAVMLPGPGTHRLVLPAPSMVTAYVDASCGPDRLDASAYGQSVVIARFRLDEAADVTVEARDAATGILLEDGLYERDRPRIVLRAWNACPYGPNEYCRLEPSIVRRGLPAGEWALIVAAPILYTGAPGRPTDRPIDLVLSLAPATIPAVDHDRCEPSTRAIVPGETYTGAFSDLSDDTPCGNMHIPDGPDGMGGWRPPRTARSRDAVYRLTLDRRSLVVVEGTPARIVPACDWRSCQAGPVGSEGRALGAGTYYVVIETGQDEVAPITEAYSFRIELRDPPPPPPGDRCEDPLDAGEEVRFDENGSFDFYAYSNDALQACTLGPAFYPDIVRRLELTAMSDVVVGAGGFYSLQPECGATASALEGTCFGGPHRYRSVAPGTYYLVVSSNQPQQLSVTLESPVVDTNNDRCADAIEIDATWSGDASFWGASDDYALCRSGARDVVYRLTLTERRRVQVVVPADLSAALQTSCGGTRSVACGSGGATAVLDPGIYFVVVESPTEGEFPIGVLLTSP